MFELFNVHRKIIIQILSLVLILCLIQFVLGMLPTSIAWVVKILLTVLWLILLGMILLFFSLQVILNFRFERSFVPKKLQLNTLPALKNYRIHNPLDTTGTFYKAQLHTHTNRSYDGKLPPEQVVESYRLDGYNFLVITDHDRISDFTQLSSADLLVIPGIEQTIPILGIPIPLGKHLVVINPLKNKAWTGSAQEQLNRAVDNDCIAFPAHLGWRGGAGSGRWYPDDLLKLEHLQLIEIDSPHSRDPIDFTLWHQVLYKNGPHHPVWGVAVDDAHHGSSRQGWIMVKTPRRDLPSFIQALKRGAFYATNGPSLEIQTTQQQIIVTSPGAQWIRFINFQNQVVAAFRAEHATYQSQGDEGFLRVEVLDTHHRTAWSQPMWLMPSDEA